MDSIYLDNNATTVIDADVVQAMSDAHRLRYVNPASQHEPGRRSRKRLELAREKIARPLGGDVSAVNGDQLVLTSGGTEANNLAIFGLTQRRAGAVAVSAVEHPSVLEAAAALAESGREVIVLPVDQRGVVDIEFCGSAFAQQNIALVSVMLANHETGALQPVPTIAGLARRNGALMHTDAVQAVGKIAVDVVELGVDALTFSTHKIHGPRAFGGLLLRPGVTVEPRLFGGAQQFGLRPGTECVATAIGGETAVEKACREQLVRGAEMAALRDRLEANLDADCPSVSVNGGATTRLPHTSNVAFPGLDRQALLMALDIEGVAAATGSACSSGSSEPSTVLAAMGLGDEIIGSSLRFSISPRTTREEIDRASATIARVARRLSGG